MVVVLVVVVVEVVVVEVVVVEALYKEANAQLNDVKVGEKDIFAIIINEFNVILFTVMNTI